MIVQWKWRLAQFFEIRWWKRYLKKRDKISYLDWKKAYWRHFLEAADMTVPSGKSILDAGCGPAGIFILLQENEVWAVDPLLEKYARELDHFNPEDYPRVRFHTARLEDWRPPEQPFDLVFCLNALNHVDDLERAVRQLRRCTAPNGSVVLSVDVHRYRWLQFLFTLFPGDILHPHQYGIDDYLRLMERHGLRVDKNRLIKRTLIFDYQLLKASPIR